MKRAILLVLGLLPAAAIGAGAFSACLPGDTRPVPGRVYISIRPSSETVQGFTTSDGWRVSFDHVYAGVGNVDLGRHHDDDDGGVESVDESDGCASYGDAHYTKLFDFASPAATGSQKVGEIYGLGTCPVSFELHPWSSDAPLTAGVTTEDVVAADQVVSIASGVPAEDGPVFHLIGHATKDEREVRFDWVFLQGLNFSDCPTSTATDKDASPITNVDLAANDLDRFEIVVHGEELFRTFPIEGTPFYFDAIADGDSNGDGTVDLSELTSTYPPFQGSELVDGGAPNLAQVLYFSLLPRVFQIGGGPCRSEVHEHHF